MTVISKNTPDLLAFIRNRNMKNRQGDRTDQRIYFALNCTSQFVVNLFSRICLDVYFIKRRR
jgi:hypothetical protein